MPSNTDNAYIDSNFTVTLTADADPFQVYHTNGTINLSSFKMTAPTFSSTGSTSRTINLSSGQLESKWQPFTSNGLILSGTGLTFSAGTSLVTLKGYDNTHTFNTLGFTFNDVTILMGNPGNSTSETLNITGSPTFRSLIIQSKNSAAHTVTLGGNIIAPKFVAIGSSSGSKLSILTDGSSARSISLGTTGSSYGQFVSVGSSGATGAVIGTSTFANYIGSNSVVNASSFGWTLQDPPLISTLSDFFTGTTINSARWTTSVGGSGYITQNGTLSLGWGGGSSSYYQISSKDTYNLSAADLIIEIVSNTIASFLSIIPGVSLVIDGSNLELSNNGVVISTATLTRYTRLRYTSGQLRLATSTDGINYTTASGGVIVSAEELSSVRFYLSGNRNLSSGELVIDAINPSPTMPVASFNTSVTTGNTPLSVSFTDTSSGIITSWLWDFGDGTTSTSQNPLKNYTSAGTYTVALTATNALGSNTVTKTNHITVTPNSYSREAKGTLTYGGGVSSRMLKAYREAKGALTYGGGAFAFIRKNTDAVENKTFLYKVYDPTGNYIEIWNDVVSEPTFTQEINSTGSTMQIDLARNSDSLATKLDNIQDNLLANILDSDGFALTGTGDQRNQVGPGSSVIQNNRVDVLAYYGSVEPLLDSMDDEILDSSGDSIDTTLGAPNGSRIFTGYISEVNTRYGSTENTTVLLNSFGADLAQYPLMDGTGKTTVAFNSTDPSVIVKNSLDLFIAQSNAEQLTYTTYTPSSVSTSGTSVSYTFKSNTYEDVMKKSVELMPADWYFYVDLGNNTVVYRQKSATATHTFLLGKHISSLDLKSTINNSYNRVLFTGGGDPALYKDYKETPAINTRRKLYQYSDSRVTVVSSADALAEGINDENNKVQYRTTLDILDKTYDIESIKVGDTVQFRNFGNYVDQVIMQVVGYAYSPDIVQLQLDSLPPTVNKRVEEIKKNLLVSDNETLPVSPV